MSAVASVRRLMHTCTGTGDQLERALARNVLAALVSGHSVT